MEKSEWFSSWLLEEGSQPLLVTGDSKKIAPDTLFKDQLNDVEMVSFPDDGKLTIKQVREITEKLETTTTQRFRLVYIPDAERLLLAASNALLKTLETPNPKVKFLLTTSYPGRLLVTIRSRCLIVRLPRTTTQETEAKVPTFDSKRKTPITDEEALAIGSHTLSQLRQGTPTPEMQRRLVRLRDFYKAKAAGSGEKLASDALLASLC